MARTTTDRLKFNPPLGNLPAPQFLLPEQLQIDESYQRSIDTSASQALIRKIAQHWNWDLCLALVVARRENGDLFVIDGQHRLEAARLRGDIAQLPAMVKNYTSPADEAASFVQLNQARAALTGLQLFHAALASGDSTAIAVRDAITGAGLKLGRSNNLQLAPIGTVINVGGILRAWKRHGAAAATEALELLAAAFAGQRLLYAGTIYPGLAATCARELRDTGPLSPGRFAMLSAMLGGREQAEWRRLIYQAKAADPGMSIADAAAVAIAQAWTARSAAVKASPPPGSPAQRHATGQTGIARRAARPDLRSGRQSLVHPVRTAPHPKPDRQLHRALLRTGEAGLTFFPRWAATSKHRSKI